MVIAASTQAVCLVRAALAAAHAGHLPGRGPGAAGPLRALAAPADPGAGPQQPRVSCPAFPGQGIMDNLRGCLQFQVLIQDLLRGPVAEY